jgi:hypothetical protein
MTITPPASGARAARTRRPRVGFSRRAPIAAAVFALVAPLVASPILPLGMPAAADAASLTVPSAMTVASVQFRAAATDSGVLRSDGRLPVSVSVTNTSAALVDAGEVGFAVSRRPLADTTSAQEWVAGESAPALRRVGTQATGSIGPFGTASADALLEVGDDLTPGVYALRATFRTADGNLIVRGLFTVADEENEPGEVAVLVPITAGPLTAGLLTAEELTILTGDGGALRTQLDAAAGTPAILAVDPAIPAAIRVLGSTAPASAIDWLDDLLALPNTRFALQFGDADLAVQRAADLDSPLTVATLSPYLDLAGFEESAADEDAGDGTDPTPTPDPTTPPDGEAALPTLEELTDIGPHRADVFWPAAGTADEDLVAMLTESADDGAALTIVPSDTVDRRTGARAALRDGELLVYDSAVSDALTRASVSESAIDRAAALAEASAYGAFADDAATLLVAVGRAPADTPVSAMAPRSAVRAAVTLDGRRAIGIGELASGDDITRVRLNAVEPDAQRVRALDRLLSDEQELASFSTVLTDRSVITARERASILQLLGNAWLTSPQAWESAVSAHEAATDTTIGSISIVPSPGLNLLGSTAPLVFSVRNDLPWPATLVLLTEPNDPRLVVQESTEFTAGAAQTSRVDVPVEARVGNGESSLDLQLRSPSMIDVGSRVTVQVSVRAEWETVGIVAIVALVGGLIVFGAIRTFLRLRRRGTSAVADGTEAGTHG